MKRLILFDIDGTLLLTQGAGRIATRNAMLEIFGTASTIDSHTFGGKTDWFTLVELLAAYDYTAEMIGERMAAFEASAARHLAEIIVNHTTTALPGAMEAVHALRGDEHTLLGIVTGNCAATAPVKLRAGGYDPMWFTIGAFGSEAIERNDLPPLALKRAIEHSRMNIDPRDVIVIGDTPADIECARVLGAQVIAVATGFSSKESLAAHQPDYLLDDLTTVMDIL